MTLLASLAALAGIVLLYLCDPQQRWRAAPLPRAVAMLGALLLLLSLMLWGLALGWVVGVLAGLWTCALSAMLLPIIVCHANDTFRKRRRGA